MPKDKWTKPEIRREPDGRVSFIQRAHSQYPTQVPKELLRDSPKWAESLIERGTTFVELVETLGEVARGAQTMDQRRNLLRVVEQLGVTDEGRETIDRVLGPGFIPWLTAATLPAHLASYVPVMIVFENANAPGRSAWISPWEDEEVWPVATLQQLNLDQAISAVWQTNSQPFVELFLFDGPDLQGRFTRIVRVQTPEPPLDLVLDDPGLDDQSRSLLGSVRSTPGRRFSAAQELTSTVELAFSQWAADFEQYNGFGTITLTDAPRFTWDGYQQWLNSSGWFPPLPKTAALSVQIFFRIDDVDYGSTTGSMLAPIGLRRIGGTNPITGTFIGGQTNLPQPWAGNWYPTIRWDEPISIGLSASIAEAVETKVGVLAGPLPGSIRIFPGRSTTIPSPPSTHWGLIELGRTDDDASIVLSP